MLSRDDCDCDLKFNSYSYMLCLSLVVLDLYQMHLQPLAMIVMVGGGLLCPGVEDGG